ncbi:MAG: Fe-S-containing hydro-lyase [Bacillota bacterium]|nr:Fe-S-containing hydro-lyase [Candidatus Fermentithermobacillaceae bacterium]
MSDGFWEGAHRISVPLVDDSALRRLKAGRRVLLSGVVYTARDAAHKRMVEALEQGDELPIDLAGQVIYYAGPCPPAPGQVIGSLGPTTSGRMDAYAPRLCAAGLRGMIGKGQRSTAVVQAIARYGAVYFVTIGGAGALLSQAVRKAQVVAYADLGPEAVHRLEIVDFPALVGIDPLGRDMYDR